MAFESVDPDLMKLIVGVFTVISGVVAGLIRWSHVSLKSLIVWAKPHVEGFIEDNRSLVRTLEKTQLATTGHIEHIHVKLGGVEATLQQHGQKLDTIEKHTCPELRTAKESNA